MPKSKRTARRRKVLKKQVRKFEMWAKRRQAKVATETEGNETATQA